jgi:uncharacterized protein
VTSQAQKKQPVVVDEQQVIDYLISHPDFFVENSLLLADMKIPHESGMAVSLIERQITLLRNRNEHFETKLREMVDAVHDNQRLNSSLQRLAINLFLNEGLDDIIATVIEELRDELATDFISIRLLTDDKSLVEQQPERYILKGDEVLACFSKLIEEKRIQCGRLTDQQASLLFPGDLDGLGSGAVISIADVDSFGLLGLGSKDDQHYHPGMGTEFLQQLSDLVSAAIKPHLAS